MYPRLNSVGEHEEQGATEVAEAQDEDPDDDSSTEGGNE